MQKLNTLFGQNSQLEALSKDLHRKSLINQFWQSAVPTALSNHSFAYQLENGVLLVFATNSAVASKISFTHASLLKALEISKNSRAEFQPYKVTAIKVKVQVKSQPKPRPKRVMHLSSSGAQHLDTLANQMPDTALGQALKKLASRKTVV